MSSLKSVSRAVCFDKGIFHIDQRCLKSWNLNDRKERSIIFTASSAATFSSLFWVSWHRRSLLLLWLTFTRIADEKNHAVRHSVRRVHTDTLLPYTKSTFWFFNSIFSRIQQYNASKNGPHLRHDILLEAEIAHCRACPASIDFHNRIIRLLMPNVVLFPVLSCRRCS